MENETPNVEVNVGETAGSTDNTATSNEPAAPAERTTETPAPEAPAPTEPEN